LRKFPKIIKVRQRFEASHIADIETHLMKEFKSWEAAGTELDGKDIAITAGSRGITDIREIMQVLISYLKSRKANPFLVPAMGSHGGAREEGQGRILDYVGVSETSLGVPIRNSMEVREIGKTSTGLPVYCDKFAASAQGVIVVNRIKDHTDFEGRFESGLVKMMVIGLGKHQGALTVHNLGIRGFKEEMARCAEVALANLPLLFGIGIVENAHNQTAMLEVIDSQSIFDREPLLLGEAKRLRSKLPIEDFDILVVEEMGKNISGTGLDTNVIGRRLITGEPEPVFPRIKRLVVLSLSDNSHGNAVGIGLADICTRRLINKIDFEATYINTITATYVERARIPMTVETDRDAIEIALNTCWLPDRKGVKMGLIKNTKSLDTIWLSEGLLPIIREREDLQVIGSPEKIQFDSYGKLDLLQKEDE
jgi:hypothetical protein